MVCHFPMVQRTPGCSFQAIFLPLSRAPDPPRRACVAADRDWSPPRGPPTALVLMTEMILTPRG
jgi:hypothetical protein